MCRKPITTCASGEDFCYAGLLIEQKYASYTFVQKINVAGDSYDRILIVRRSKSIHDKRLSNLISSPITNRSMDCLRR